MWMLALLDDPERWADGKVVPCRLGPLEPLGGVLPETR